MVFFPNNIPIIIKIIYYYHYIYNLQPLRSIYVRSLATNKYAWEKRKMRQLWEGNAKAVHAKEHGHRLKRHDGHRMAL